MPQRRSRKPTISVRVELTPQENAIVETAKAHLSELDEGTAVTKARTIAWLIRKHGESGDSERLPRALDLLENHFRRRLKDLLGSKEEAGLEEALSLIMAFRTALAGRDWQLP